MYLLDTNVVSELRLVRVGRADTAVVEWSAKQPDSVLFLSAMTVMELEIGVLRMTRRDPKQGNALRGWLTNFLLPSFAGRILTVDHTIATLAASFHVPNPAPFSDSLIAATAIVNGLTLATRNTADFQRVGLNILNPWDAV